MAELGGPERVQRAMSVLEQYAGAKPGFRRAHARGVGFRGRFTGASEAAAVTTAEHFQGEDIDVVVRLSNGSANPYQVDRSSAKSGAVLGLGVRFELPSGFTAAWASLSVGAFPARKPDDFIGMTRATARNRQTGLPNFLRLVPFLALHPQCIRGAKEIALIPSTESFATTQFNGLHAYWLVDADGRRRAFRYRWLPVAGIAPVTDAEDRILPPQYLLSEIKQRIAAKPVAWDLVFQMADRDDPVDDMTRHWPEDRRQIPAGRLVIDRLHEDQEAIEGLVFDPTKVPPGIELSDDPVLHFRSESYTESHRRRTGESKPAIRSE
ncbi:MAG: catalase [Solirubrobacteraceae bacterium]|nr:catalase [Solirubrobacteraceae bacterium]